MSLRRLRRSRHLVPVQVIVLCTLALALQSTAAKPAAIFEVVPDAKTTKDVKVSGYSKAEVLGAYECLEVATASCAESRPGERGGCGFSAPTVVCTAHFSHPYLPAGFLMLILVGSLHFLRC